MEKFCERLIWDGLMNQGAIIKVLEYIGVTFGMVATCKKEQECI